MIPPIEVHIAGQASKASAVNKVATKTGFANET
jgi:hypothetical protein